MGIMEIVWMLVVGLIVGALGRLLVPGPDPMGIIATSLLGIVGSFVGGALIALLTTGELTLTAAGWLGSIGGAMLAVIIYRALTRRRTVL